jgi:hypothetical protein
LNRSGELTVSSFLGEITHWSGWMNNRAAFSPVVATALQVARLLPRQVT